MPAATDESVLRRITEYYLGSGDFNGLSAHRLSTEFGEWDTLRPIVERQIEQGLIGVLAASDIELNPHIVRRGFPSAEQQVESLTSDLHHVCLYPTSEHLAKVVDHSKYDGEPFRLAMALGSPQLKIRCFDLAILEMYRNDPRYIYDCNDIGGWISVSNEHFNSSGMAEKDKVVVESFGFAFNDDLHRGVAAFVCDLAQMSPEHQQIWKAREHPSGYKAHPDWYRSQLLGHWPSSVPVCQACLTEVFLINKMAAAMGRPKLFRKDYGEYCEGRPKKFALLIRPTQSELNEFVHLSDKLLSENLNKKFFGDDVPTTIDVDLGNGRFERRPKGTMTLLDEWIRQEFKSKDWSSWDRAIATFKDVRMRRQNPAHAINEDAFDQKFVQEQRELVVSIYQALTVLRQILQIDSQVQAAKIQIPDWLEKGNILSY
jgi:hypothetical protein